MFTWNYSEKVATQATPEQVWEIWQNAASWPCWDKELEWAQIEGEFVVGTLGSMKPVNGPEVKFQLVDIYPLRSFSNVAQLPFAALTFEHEYILPQGECNSAYIRHSVIISGVLAPLFGYLIGRKIKIHLREAMQNMSQQAFTGGKELK